MNYLPNTDKDNLYYPAPTVESMTENLGEYGLAARKFLLENRPALYKQWQTAGSLNEYLLGLDARYQTLKVKMIKQLEQNDSSLESTRFLASASRRYAIEAQAEEFVNTLLSQELEYLAK